MSIEYYKDEVHKIVKKYFPMDIKRYDAMIQELAEYIDEEQFQARCDSMGDDC